MKAELKCVLYAVFLIAVACGPIGGQQSPGAGDTVIIDLTGVEETVPIEPASANLGAGESLQFTAPGAGPVLWSISPPAGSISAAGLYTAPSQVIVPQTLSVIAITTGSPRQTGKATVNLVATAQTTTVLSVNPATAALSAGQSQQFSVSGGGAVTWSADPAVGTVDAQGLYRAPATVNAVQTVYVTARSAADPSVEAYATVTLRPAGAFAAHVQGATATQAVLSYVAPDQNPCTVEVRDAETGELAHDVNPALFPGSESDGGGDPQRFFVAGKKRADRAADGKHYSRALETSHRFDYQVSCGARKTFGSFSTQTIPFGVTFNEPLPFSRTDPDQYALPTLDQNDRSQIIIDPLTGARIRRVSLPGDVPDRDTVWHYSGSADACGKKPFQGGYLCTGLNSGGGFTSLFWVRPDDGEARFLGLIKIRPKTTAAETWRFANAPASPAMWDSNDPNVYYGLVYDRHPKDPEVQQLLLKGTYSGGVVGAAPGEDAPFNWENVTPGKSMTDLARAEFPDFDSTKFSLSLRGVSGKHVLFSAARHYQNSYGWVLVFDKNARKFIAGVKVWEQPETRWCGLHLLEMQGDSPLAGISKADMFGGGATGPYEVSLTRAASPADTQFLVSGEPASTHPEGDPFLMNAEAGDIFTIGSEAVTIVAKNGKTWTVARGPKPKNHAQGASLKATCKASGRVYWRFLDDPRGVDLTNTKYAVDQVMGGGHRAVRDPYEVKSQGTAYLVREGSVFTNRNKSASYSIQYAPGFDRVAVPANGNSYQKHPWVPSNGKHAWFLDAMPFVGGLNLEAEKVSGQLYRVRPKSGSGLLLDDRLPYFGMSGGKMLRDVSGPGSRISGTSQDAHQFCVARNEGECVAGSAAGEVFANLPQLKWTNCRITATMIPDGADVCIGNLASYGQAVTQFGLSKPPNDRPGANNRVLTRYLGGYRRGTIYANAKALPDGSWALFPGSFDPLEIFAVKIPPAPQSDGLDRSKYIPVSVSIPSHPAATKARLAYGYEENGGRRDFFCTQRPEPCVLPATPGSSVEVPAVTQRVLFHEVQYLDASGAVIGKSGLSASAVP